MEKTKLSHNSIYIEKQSLLKNKKFQKLTEFNGKYTKTLMLNK